MAFDAYRQRLTDGRQSAREALKAGASGLEVGERLTTLVESIILDLFQWRLGEVSASERPLIERQLALCPVAGLGRRDLSPYSDIDLLFLHKANPGKGVVAFCKQLVRDIWDVGLELGQTVADPTAVMRLAREEIMPLTGLLESRFLVGREGLFDGLKVRLQRYLRFGGAAKLYDRALAEIRSEQREFGSTVHLLEPDVKKSAGGLRDLHLIRWLGAGFFGTHDLVALEAAGALGEGDAATLGEARDFLLRIRASLHFTAGRAADTLSRGEQLRIAREWGYADTPALLAVEQLMRDYFQRTSAIAEAQGRFLDRIQPRTGWGAARDRLFAKRIGPGLRLVGDRLVVDADARAAFVDSLEKTLELAQVVAATPVDLDRETVESLRRSYRPALVTSRSDVIIDSTNGPRPSREAIDRFMSLLSQPGSIAKALRLLHKVGVLERLIPAFEHARGLLQFNAYHKYTVDEHTFVMLEEAEKLATSDDIFGRAYRNIDRKDLLHLAILLHDLGKGLPEDHSEVGRRIAEATADRFQLDDESRRTLVYLVFKHLFMSDLAYKRDTQDTKIQLALIRGVGSVTTLRMLFVLTAVDNIAVGPGTFNKWKSDLLCDLYSQGARLLGDDEPLSPLRQRAAATRQRLIEKHGDDERTRGFIEQLPTSFLAETSIEDLVAQLLEREAMAIASVLTLTEYLPSTGTVLYTIMTHERVGGGIFHKICGALTAHYLEVLSARIYTLPDGTVVDRFEVIDTHHVGAPTADRCKMVGATIRKALTGELSVDDILWSRRSSIFVDRRRVVGRDETNVAIDNDSSDTATVIDVFTNDRQGLLYTLTRGIYRLGLSVTYAKIATFADQVVDVFYVQESNGRKARGAERIRQIVENLTRDVNQLASDPRSMGF